MVIKKIIFLILSFSFIDVEAITGICPTVGDPTLLAPGVAEARVATDEALMVSAIAQATILATICVPTPVDPVTAAACVTDFATYTATVTALSLPCSLDITVNPVYLVIPFTPCKYTAAGLFYFPYCAFNE